MNLYDLRYLRHIHNSRTDPLIAFPAYSNISALGYRSGFDIHRTHNLIAAACEPSADEPPVSLFDARTGKELAVGLPRSGNRQPAKEERRMASGVQFVERASGQMSLMVASGDGLNEYCW